MFIAGIELFFGFVAGALILIAGLIFLRWFLRILPLAFRDLVKLLSWVAAGGRQFRGWINYRRRWIAAVALYCWVVDILCESSSAVNLEIGFIMATLLLLAALFKFYLFSNRKKVRL